MSDPCEASDVFTAVVRQVVTRQKRHPFVLFLGSEVGPPWLDLLIDRVLDGNGTRLPANCTAAQRVEAFEDAWKQQGPEPRIADFHEAYAKVIEDPKRAAMVQAYIPIARLILDGYFQIVLTTDPSPMLEDALLEARARSRDVKVFDVEAPQTEANGLWRYDLAIPKVKVIKLFGDGYAASFRLNGQRAQERAAIIEGLLARPAVLVGLDETRDMEVVKHLPAGEQELFLVSRVAPPQSSLLHDRVTRRRANRIISGDIGSYDAFFQCLGRRIFGEHPGGIGLKTIADAGVEFADMQDEQVKRVTTAVKQAQDNVTREVKQRQERGGDGSPYVEFIGDLMSEGFLNPVVEELKRSIRRPLAPVDFPDDTIFTIRYDENAQRVSFHVRGGINYTSTQNPPLRIDAEGLNRVLRDLGDDIRESHLSRDGRRRRSWRERARREGALLYRDLFASNAELMEQLGAAQMAAALQNSEDLFVCFEGPRGHLGLPYELLYDSSAWALRGPLFRRVDGIRSSRPGVFDLLSRSRGKPKQLRVLLVAADPVPESALAVDAEVQGLKEFLPRKTKELQLGVDLEVDCVPAREATVQNVSRRLERGGPYHIVHFAAHGTFDENTGEASALLLKDGSLSTVALNACMQQSETCLLFLNTCVGATIASPELLRSRDFLGLMDAALKAGVPAVLGYRWYVRDASARAFAETFYGALLGTRSAPRAVLQARKKLYTQDPDDETWTSPILVVQNL